MSRRDDEIEYGKKLTMAKALVDDVSSKLPGKVTAQIGAKGLFADWTIKVTIEAKGETLSFEERMETFPSNELLATAMILA